MASMNRHAHLDLAPSLVKVLVITTSWTAFLVFAYVSTYLSVGDLIQMGKLSGTYAFWPDLAGNAVIGLFSGLVGGSLLVFKVNAGYRHKTFLSGIVNSVVLFSLIYLTLAVGKEHAEVESLLTSTPAKVIAGRE
jgi:adenylate cyclase